MFLRHCRNSYCWSWGSFFSGAIASILVSVRALHQSWPCGHVGGLAARRGFPKSVLHCQDVAQVVKVVVKGQLLLLGGLIRHAVHDDILPLVGSGNGPQAKPWHSKCKRQWINGKEESAQQAEPWSLQNSLVPNRFPLDQRRLALRNPRGNPTFLSVQNINGEQLPLERDLHPTMHNELLG